MSFLSASENVGFSGIPQNISDASCATQYKMGVDGVPGGGDVNIFIHDSSGDEQNYIPQLNDNFFHTKFKIDPNDLYTFHDSDVIAGEITVSHTEDNFMYGNTDEIREKVIDSPSKELDLVNSLTNGDVKEIKKEIIPNGHYTVDSQPTTVNVKNNTKVTKTKNLVRAKEQIRTNVTERRSSVHSPKGQNHVASLNSNVKASISSVNGKTKAVAATELKANSSETFLDVFKREQGLVENTPVVVKTEPVQASGKTSASTPKKAPSAKPSTSKSKRGRGPAVHEALQRIPAPIHAIPLPNRAWHAPGDELFDCGPLDNSRPYPYRLESSSSDDDNIPDFEYGTGPVCVEESAAESRGARLALRRAALRRHVARADTSLRMSKGFREYRELATLVKKQMCGKNSSSRLPTQTVNYLLAMRGMPTLLSTQERRQLRESGWSGAESATDHTYAGVCAEERCENAPLPSCKYCLNHVTSSSEQRLFASCSAVFANGSRCQQPLLPLKQTPLCDHHAWKRDNYDKLSSAARPKKMVRVRAASAPRKVKRRRRAPTYTADVNMCSNSSTYDSGEDAPMALSETEYISTANNSHELEVEVGQVPPDDILDPAVLSQIPDEAFTEFFNQAEGGPGFAESSELAAALEAVLDERVLDDVFSHSPKQTAKKKVQVPTAVAMEMSTSALS